MVRDFADRNPQRLSLTSLGNWRRTCRWSGNLTRVRKGTNSVGTAY